MKKNIIACLIMLMSFMALNAKDFNSAQLQLRSSINSFLREEGFMPEYDSDGDIKFKKEGKTYYVIVSDVDTNPLYISISHLYSYDEVYTYAAVKNAVKEINQYKGIKLKTYDSTYSFAAEMYLHSADQFRYTFYKYMKNIAYAEDELETIVKGK